MIWLKKLTILFLLAALMVTASSLFFQTGSAADERIAALADQRSGNELLESSVYYETPKKDAISSNDAAQADYKDAAADVPMQPSVSANTAKLSAFSAADTTDSDPLSGFSPDDWRLILVNKQHPIPDDYKVELDSIHNGLKVDKRITHTLDAMLSAAKEDGILLLVISPYRDQRRQTDLFEKKVRRRLKQDSDFLTAYKDTAQAVTIPGSSEHEIGLAVDIATKQHITLDAEFAETEGGKWLAKHCTEYGFILRYPLGKEEITGIEFEPWHFRYVGKEAACYITENNLTLEEFYNLIRRGTF